MINREKQAEELKVVYRALKDLTGKTPDAYTTPASVSIYAVELTGSSSLYYLPGKVPKLLDKLYKEGKAKRIQIVARRSYTRRIGEKHHTCKQTRRSHWAYRVAS